MHSNMFAGAPRSAKYNPLNLKFDKNELNTKARPLDHDVLNQSPVKRQS